MEASLNLPCCCCSSIDSVGVLNTNGNILSASEECLNLGLVGGVGHEGGNLASHAVLGKLEDHIILIPELLLVGLSSLAVDGDGVQAESFHHTVGSFVVGVLREEAHGSVDEAGEASTTVEVDVIAEGGSVALGNLALLNEVGEAELEHVLSVVLPHSAEVRLLGEVALVLMGVNHVLLGDQLGYELAGGLPLLLELLTAFWGGGVDAQHEFVLLIGMGEGVKGLFGLVEVTTVSEPGRLGGLVVEQTGRRALTPLLKSEPVEDVRLESLTSELHGGPLGVEVVHGVLPCLSGVSIELPAVTLLSGGPVGDLETLEEGSRPSVESDITDALEKGLGVEVLSVDVMLDVGLLVEFIAIEVLNANTYIILN